VLVLSRVLNPAPVDVRKESVSVVAVCYDQGRVRFSRLQQLFNSGLSELIIERSINVRVSQRPFFKSVEPSAEVLGVVLVDCLLNPLEKVTPFPLFLGGHDDLNRGHLFTLSTRNRDSANPSFS